MEKYAVHALGAAGEGTFFALDFGVRGRVGPRAPGPGQKRDGYFSRWPSPVSRRSARWEDRFHSGLNPVIYPRCRKPCNNAFTDEPATTATVTARRGGRVWPPCCCFPLRLSMSPLRFLFPFRFFSLPPFSLFLSWPFSVSVLSVARTLQTTRVRTVSAKFILKIERRRRGYCIGAS